jgi:glycosyltransferase involved in cell wall biosynthesis
VRILYVTPLSADGCGVGGVQTYARALPAAMAALGHEVRFVHADPLQIMSSLTVGDRIPRPRWLRHRYYFWRSMYAMDYRYQTALGRLSRRAVREFSPDLIHSLHCDFYGAVAGVPVPFVISGYGLEIVPDPPVLGSLGDASGIHCISEFTKRHLLRVCPRSDADVGVLSWGIRPSKIRRDTVSADYDLITVGRLVKRKNIDTIIRALASAPDLRYAVVGDGPELPRLRQLAAESGVSNVDFLGSVSDEEKQALLNRSRVFIMCPRRDDEVDVEGLGLVYYEAQGLGLPTIAAESGGVAEAVGLGGLLVSDPHDPGEVLKTIRMALEPAALARLREAVAARQVSHSWDRFIRRFEAWYEQVIHRAYNSRPR